jgi:DNA/RNA-binding domain of Phe-tRNA-synthetase-like protein
LKIFFGTWIRLFQQPDQSACQPPSKIGGWQKKLMAEGKMNCLTDLFTFEIDPRLAPLGIQGCFLVMDGLQNRDTDLVFEEIKAQSLQAILAENSWEGVRNDPALQGFRELHTQAGFSDCNYPAAPEVLFDAVLRSRRLTHINLLVDICNLVSLETKLMLGAHDLDQVCGNIHLGPMTGAEKYIPQGGFEEQAMLPGGYAYIDEANDILCLLDSRQAEKSRVRLQTTRSFYVLQGHRNTPAYVVERAAERLIDLTTRFCGGDLVYSRSFFADLYKNRGC